MTMNIKSLIAATIACLALAGSASAATIGHTPVDGAPDTAASAGFVMISDPVSVGDAGVVTEFSFYSKILGTTITPLIFDNAFEVIGVGTTRTTTTGDGVETFAFGLVAGSADIGPDKFFGWQPAGTDVSPVAFNAGHATSYFLAPVDLGLGGTASIVGNLNREYSMQFTTVPEPGSLALLGLGGLCVLRRRRG